MTSCDDNVIAAFIEKKHYSLILINVEEAVKHVYSCLLSALDQSSHSLFPDLALKIGKYIKTPVGLW